MFPGLEIMYANETVTIGRVGDRIVLLILDSSDAGWRVARTALADLGLERDSLALHQECWWADGAELWVLDPEP